MKKHEILRWIGLAMAGIPLIWIMFREDRRVDATFLPLVGCMVTGTLVMMYAQSIDPHLHFMYKGSFIRTLLMFLAVSGVGWLLTLGGYWVYRVVTSP